MKVLECLKGIGGDLLLGEPGTEVDEVAYDSRWIPMILWGRC